MIEDFILPGTKFTVIDGIYQILKPGFKEKIEDFVKYSIEAKSSDNLDPIMDYNELPFINATKYKSDWSLRREDLKNIQSEIREKKGLAILESGSFNNWLTHHLHNMGHKVVCLDYFTDKTYGLKSKFHYKDPGWISIQCNMEDINFLRPEFDLVVLNHGIQFYSSIEIPIGQLKKILKPGGKFIILGLFIFMNDSRKKDEVEAYKKEFRGRTGLDKFMFPQVKGFLNRSDLKILKKEGIRLIPYKSCMLQNMAARLIRTRQLNYYGVYVNAD